MSWTAAGEVLADLVRNELQKRPSRARALGAPSSNRANEPEPAPASPARLKIA
jgi:hypothetical protein